MSKSAEFIAGYEAALKDVEQEGDYRSVDWSEAVVYLRKRRSGMTPTPPSPPMLPEYEYVRLFVGGDMALLNRLGKESWALCGLPGNGYAILGRKRIGL